MTHSYPEHHSPFRADEPVFRLWLLAMLGLVLLVNLCWLTLTRVSVDWQGSVTVLILPLAWLVLLGGLERAHRRRACPPTWLHRARDIAAGLLFLSTAWLTMRLFNHLTFTTALPFADDWLVSLDLALGLQWRSYFDFVAAYPMLVRLLDASYVSLDSLSLAAMVFLLALGQRARVRVFVESFFLCALLAAVTGFWFPAEAAIVHILGEAAAIPGFSQTPGIYHMVHLDALRNPEGEIRLNLGRMPGLVTFPSFHTAAGIILASAFWRTRMFVPVVLYGAIMIASTPVFGGHYFVDLLAGVVLATVSLVTVTRLPGNRGVLCGGSPRQA